MTVAASDGEGAAPRRGLARLAPRAWLLVVLAAATMALAVAAGPGVVRLVAGAATFTFCLLAIGLRALDWQAKRRQASEVMQIARLVEQDAAPCFATDVEGAVLYRNTAARSRFGEGGVDSLAAALGDHFVSPGALLYRLQSRARATGASREDVVTRRGHTRLSVHRLDETRFLWRLEEMLERATPGRGAETLSLPMLVANKAGVVLFMNEAMRRLLGSRVRQLDRIFTSPDIRSGEEVVIATPEGPVRALVAELEGAGERREIYLLPVGQQASGPAPRSDFEHLPVALLRLDGSALVRSANLAARDLLRWPGEGNLRLPELLEGLGRSLSDWTRDVLAERVPGGTEVLRLRNSDADRFVQVTLRRVVDGDRAEVLAVLHDATEFKSLEAQFTQSQKMQAIGQLAGGIAHDFNNLLTAISGHCDLLLLRHRPEELEYADLVQISQNANRAAALVGKLLAFSRKQTLQLEPTDLQEVLSDLTHLLNRLVGEKVRLELRHAPDVGFIRSDRQQLEQAIINLVVNARDAMPSGGTIRIRTERRVLDAEVQRDGAVMPPGTYAVITVSDTGTGIPQDLRGRIFDPFFTTKRPGEGTGLGLSMTYGFVKQTGGYIFVDSEPGQGTEFQLYFLEQEPEPEAMTIPMLPPLRARPRDFAPPPPALRPEDGVVLLVEDEPPVRAVASRALRLKGFTVLEAENAEAALKLLEDRSVQVDIFVTDVVMPGMDGPSWVMKALEQRPKARVVFMSGYAEDSFADRRDQIAGSVFLPKPFSLADLTSTVQGQLVH